MAMRVCTKPGCPTLVDAGRCAAHRAQAERVRRPLGNPYATKGHRRFREGVLARNPICVLCLKVKANVADHYPKSRRELVRLGLDPDDPKHGRGLCKACHDRETAVHQPGGWNA